MSTTAKRFVTQELGQVEIYGHVGIMDVQLKNLSQTGAFIEMAKGDYVPKKGDLLNLTVTLDKIKKSHNVDAQVVWSKGFGMGICFISKDEVLERMMAKSDEV
ncbi:PilZ domain protein [compost metagenome]